MFFKISENTRENTTVGVFFTIKLHPRPLVFIKKQTLVQVFSCEFQEIFKNIFLLNISGRLL